MIRNQSIYICPSYIELNKEWYKNISLDIIAILQNKKGDKSECRVAKG